jgi:hypothetical protein
MGMLAGLSNQQRIRGVCRVCSYSHTQLQGFTARRKVQTISRHFVLVSVVFLAMAGWQYKLMNELDRERARSTVGWSKCGPTAAGRLALMLDGTIPLHEGIYISTSPCVAFKWRGAEIMEDPLSLLLVRNDAKAGGVTR